MPNCQFVQESSEVEDWHYPYKFDYVHLRDMQAALHDAPTVMRKAFASLRSGGWLEFQEVAMDLRFHESSLQGTAVGSWHRLVNKGGLRMGRDFCACMRYKQQLIDVGFVDVHEVVLDIPSGTWTDGRQEKLAKLMNIDAMVKRALISHRQYILAAGDIPPGEIEDFMRKVSEDCENPGVRWVVPL